MLRDGSTVVHELDEQGRVKTITWGDREQTEIEFDAAGNIAAARNKNGEISHTFNAAGDPLTETTSAGTIVYTYDPEGRLIRLVYPDGQAVEYEYDEDGRVCLVRDWDGRENRIVYSQEGGVAEIHYGNGIIEKQQPARNGRVQHSALENSDGRKIGEQLYEYDIFDRLIGSQDIWGSEPSQRSTRRLSYDAESRLTGEIEGIGKSPTYTYTYDRKGNLSSDNGKFVEVGLFDEIVQHGDILVEYDANGNARRLPGPRGNVELTFSSDGNLREARIGPGKVQFSYDALGRRILKKDGKAETRYEWAGSQMLVEKTLASPDASPIRRDYLYLPGVSIPLAFREDGNTYWLQCDARGAVIRAFDINARTVWRARYESFGCAIVDVREVQQPWRLPGQYEDTETGLYYNFARYYCPWLKTYLSQDPNWWQIGATAYSYAANDPWNKIDPAGSAPTVLTGSVQVAVTKSEPGFWAKVGEIAVDVAVIAGGVALAVVAAPVVAAIGLTGAAAVAAVGVIAGGGAALLTFGGELAKQAIRGDPLCLSCALKEALLGALIDIATLKLGRLIPKSLIKSIAKRLTGKAARFARKLLPKRAKDLIKKAASKAKKTFSKTVKEEVKRGAKGGKRAGKTFTPAGKREVINRNKKKFKGKVKCESCKVETVPPKQSKKGVTPPDNEAHIDHIIPKSKGGDGAPSNGQVLCRKCNLRKSNK
jgi:RHS repeat-associated protein